MEVYSHLTNDEIDKALSGDIKVLWSVFSSVDGDKGFEETKELVQNGVYLLFNIEKVVDGYVEIYPDNSTVRVKGYKKMDYNKYKDELRIREKIMKETLREQYNVALEEQDEWEDEEDDRH